MLLSKILHGVETVDDYNHDLEVSSVELDSRNVVKGGMFIALSGKNQDGKKYIPSALAKGAKVVAYDGEYEGAEDEAEFIRLQGDMRKNIAQIAANFYPHVPQLMSAITGTNGKTSIADFTRQMMKVLGHNAASIGTVGVVADGIENIETLTTPDSITLHKILNKLAEAKVDYVSMEASSVGIEQYRMDNLPIKVAGFTNLTQDHLDYHLTMENYFRAKEQLFSRVTEAGGTAVLNADIKEFEELKSVCDKRGIKVLAYGRNGKDLRLLEHVPHADGQKLKVEILGKEYAIDLPLIGEFQAMNVLCAIGMVIALNGGYPGICATSVNSLSYWRLNKKTITAEKDVNQILSDNLEKIKQLIAMFDNPENGYITKPDPKHTLTHSDYQHLSRIDEWEVNSNEQE